MSNNGHGHAPVQAVENRFLPPRVPSENIVLLQAARRRRSLGIALALFALTALSTLAAGVQFTTDYRAGRAPSFEGFFQAYTAIWNDPRILLAGLPFSVTLLGILLAHELGHYFACRYYSISASYPYFVPAPTLIGTLGAFIRIRSPIINRKALFDVGLAGPVIGFLVAVPALAVGITLSKVAPGAQAKAEVLFGDPLIAQVLMALLHPSVRPEDVLLHPVGRAAWVGLFATALNLLPAGQLDGGHILYSLASEKHRRVSLAVAMMLVPLGLAYWWGWMFWASLLLLIGFRHPPLLNRWESLDRQRLVWAGIGLAILLLCFMPAPFTIRE